MTIPSPPGVARAAGCLLLLLAGCLPALPSPASFTAASGSSVVGNDTASRCQQPIWDYRRTRCGLDDPSQQMLHSLDGLKLRLGQFRQQCTDPASRQRLDELEATCTPLFADRERERHGERRAVRARYLAQVSALLADPDYGPLVDREKDLASSGRRNPADAARLDEVRARLSDLARKHGIDPGAHRELEIW